MKALSLWQPWASAVALGLKRIETRSWGTNFRGVIAIHASKTTQGWEDCSSSVELRVFNASGYSLVSIPIVDRPSLFQHGGVIAVARLMDCVEMTAELIDKQSDLELSMGDWRPGRFAWVLGNVRVLPKPFVCRGGQRIFNVSFDPEHAGKAPIRSGFSSAHRTP